MSIVNGLHENFEKYHIAEARLCDDISNDKLTFYEALARCHELWELIPSKYDRNSVRLNNLMKEKFGELDEYKKHYSKTFTIDIGSIDDIDVDEYVKKVMGKFKQSTFNVDLGNPMIDDYVVRFHDKYGINNPEDHFIPISPTIDEQLIDMEKFNGIMVDAKQDNAVKQHMEQVNENRNTVI